MLIVAPVTLLCCSLVVLYPAAAAYRVVVSSSPQSPIPSYTVSSVQLNCSVTPLPPGPVTYTWTAVPILHTSNPSSSNSALPTATASISYRTARHPTYYCHVHSNGTKVATGKLTLTIQGFLQYVSSPVVTLAGPGVAPGANVTLQFSISSHPYASSINTTNWFYNGLCIDCNSSSSDHYLFSNTRLTIVNASENDVGQYEVRVTEIISYLYRTSICAFALDALKHTAVYTPVVFCLTKEYTTLCVNNETAKATNLYGSINQTLLVTKKYTSPFSNSPDLYYSDGIQASYLDDPGQPFHGTNQSHIVIDIPQYNQSWAGEYTIEFYTHCYNVILSSGCYNFDAEEFLCYDLSFHNFLVLTLQIKIATLEPTLLKIQTDSVVQRGGTVTLNCSAEGGNPMDYTVQWMKDDQQLASTTSVPAVLLYTSPHYQQQFGVFTCSAINQYFHINKTVFIQERDSFQGLWVFSKPNKVLVSDISEIQSTLNNIVISAMNSISVSWTLVDDYFHNCSLHLTALAGGLYYRCDLVYSDPSGVITASTILTRTQEWLMENNITTTVNGDKLELSKLCTLRLDDSSMATCYRVIEHLAETTCNTQPTPSFSPVMTPSCPELSETTGNSAGIITGGFIGGLLLGVLTCAAGIAVILFCRFLLTRKKSNTDGQDGIELNVNTAYDTVKYERPPFQQRPPEPDTSQNPYENWVMT